MNLLNIRKVGYGVRSIDELRAPGSRPEPQPTIVSPAAGPNRSIFDDERFNARRPLPPQPTGQRRRSLCVCRRRRRGQRD